MRQLPNLEAEIVDVLLGLYRDYKPWKAPSWSSKAARGDTATHRLLFDLIAAGKVDGLRIDHPDGLYDPAHYFQHLQQRRAELRKTNGEGKPLYIVVEKIRASYEHIPKDWTIYGGTGYRFANLVNGVLVDSANQPRLDRLYAGFLGERIDFDEVLYRCKQLIMKVALASELNVLANQLSHLAQVDRHTCDFTLNSLRDALTEIVACFPGYRTYITGERITSQDQRFINWAVLVRAQADPRFQPATGTRGACRAGRSARGAAETRRIWG